MKAIGIKMVELFAMTAAVALKKGYKTNGKSGNDKGYEVIYLDGYKYWYPKEIADAAYFKLSESNDGSMILKEDVENFITGIDSTTVNETTTVVNVHTLTGFDKVIRNSCVNSNNYSKELDREYVMAEVFDSLWDNLGFVLQWAKNGLTGNK